MATRTAIWHKLKQCASRTFHEPVIRVLWRNLDALLPLWHLLAPPDTPFPFGYYHNRGLYDLDIVLAYLQKVSSAQLHLDPIRWERFLWHATHVRGIGHLSHGLEEINDASRLLVQTVVMQNGGITVLPLLRTIEWRASAPIFGLDDALVPFFTSTLRRATIDISRPDEAENILLLRRLRESSPFLEKISVDTGSQPDTSPSITQELLSFARLDQVQVSRTGLEGFQALATKSNLTYLKVREVTGPWVGSGCAISVRDLRELSVKGDASALSGLFNLVRFQALKSAKIGLKSFSETQIALADITTSLAQFYKAVSTSGFQTFELTVYSLPTIRSPGNEPALRDLLAPLLPIHDLRLFRLVAMDSIACINDADIEALARAWPKV
ncbi:hypothetical protein LXA43DRAFT_714371 [Ganoderma leucocontextum]|nr:hypothetical protein LXA43DRAFT_714371 [Ganoderma leucocontextum]